VTVTVTVTVTAYADIESVGRARLLANGSRLPLPYGEGLGVGVEQGLPPWGDGGGHWGGALLRKRLGGPSSRGPRRDAHAVSDGRHGTASRTPSPAPPAPEQRQSDRHWVYSESEGGLGPTTVPAAFNRQVMEWVLLGTYLAGGASCS